MKHFKAMVLGRLVEYHEGRGVFRPDLAAIINAGGRDVGVAEPLLHLRNARLIHGRVGRRSRP